SEDKRACAGNWDRLIEVRSAVLKSLETARQEKTIGAPLEAQVTLRAGGDLFSLLEKYGSELPGLFIVSQVSLERTGGGELVVEIGRAGGVKCERCWKYTFDTGADAKFPTICAGCAAAVTEIVNG
ncbi:MAG TPA: zinc finger domain-containing protein, partial [Bryobacteraceae bacterium]